MTKRLEDKIHNIFFDPTGKHLLISLESGDNFYLNSRWKKVKALPKFKVRPTPLCLGRAWLCSTLDFAGRCPDRARSCAAICRGRRFLPKRRVGLPPLAVPPC